MNEAERLLKKIFGFDKANGGTVGGMSAITAATVASSFKNLSIPNDTVLVGEVGLTGEVRSVNLIDKRLKEIEKLGFKTCIIPESNKKLLKEN